VRTLAPQHSRALRLPRTVDADRLIQPTCNTVIAADTHQDDLANHPCATNAVRIGWCDRRSKSDRALELALHVCCTRAITTVFADRSSARLEAQMRRNQRAPGVRPKITIGREHDTCDSVVAEGTK
jgi:hypothetical protein